MLKDVIEIELAQHLPRAGEARGAFITRCRGQGRDESACELLWQQARGMSLLLQGEPAETDDFKPTPFADLPVVDEPFNPTDQSDAEIVAEILGPDGDNFDRLKQATLAFAPGEERGDPPTTVGAYKLPVARMVGDTLKVFKGKVSDAIGAINGARAPIALTDEAKQGAYDNAVKYLRKAGVEAEDIPELKLSAGDQDDFYYVSHPVDGLTKLSDSDEGTMFRKDVLRTGIYTHPVKGWKLNINDERLNQLIAASVEQFKNGVDIEVVVDHDMKAESVRGYVKKFRRVNGSIEADVLLSEDGSKLARTVKNVSVGIKRDFKDGEGRSYGDAITHIAICQQPVVPDQKAFVALSISGADIDVPIYSLQNAGGKPVELIKQLRELIGAGDEFTEETALSRITEFFKGLEDKKSEAEKLVVSLKGELQTVKASANGGDKAKIDPDALDMIAEATEQKIEGLVEKGRLTPDAAKELSAILIGADRAQPNAYNLSRAANGGSEPLAKKMLKMLEGNDVVELAEKTGPQTMLLSSYYTDDSDKSAAEGQERLLAHLGQGKGNGQTK